jgi:hypothetical protein
MNKKVGLLALFAAAVPVLSQADVVVPSSFTAIDFGAIGTSALAIAGTAVVAGVVIMGAKFGVNMAMSLFKRVASK